MQIKDLSAILATWVGIGGALTGGFFTFREYQRENAKSADERVLQTFSMYQDFRAGLLPTAALIQEGRAAIGDLDFWINHFDMVEACVGADLCDASLVNQLFAPYAIESLTPAVQCRIADVRRMEADYGLPKPQGHGLLAIAGRAEPVCAAPPPPPTPTAQAPAPTPTAQRRAPATTRPAAAPSVAAAPAAAAPTIAAPTPEAAPAPQAAPPAPIEQPAPSGRGGRGAQQGAPEQPPPASSSGRGRGSE